MKISKNKRSSPILFTTERREALEESLLAPYAARSREANPTRRMPEESHPYRLAFQRDRDRIIHSRAFRRLKHKRQVFLTNVGDHYRTRLTHTMEVQQLSRTIARALGLNEDLTEAIALGHDLGHTPFGHLGEVVLDEILRGDLAREGEFPDTNMGGFKHNYQSVRVIDLLEWKYAVPGLNLTAAVREGILKHTALKRKRIKYPDFDYAGLHFEQDCATTLEGQVVAMADEIAQRTHDLEDGLRAGLVALEDVRELEVIRRVEDRLRAGNAAIRENQPYRSQLISALINFLVTDLLEESLGQIANFVEQKKRTSSFDCMLIKFSAEVDPLQKQLNQFIYEKIIYMPEVRKSDDEAREVLLQLYLSYVKNPGLLPAAVQDRMKNSGNADPALVPRLVADHIAGMTDYYAISEVKRLIARGLIDASLTPFDLQADWMQ